MTNETIKGGRELDAFLQKLPAKVERNIMRSALRQGANVFKDEAVPNIPVHLGDLRDSARVTVSARRGHIVASFKVGNKKAWYWRLVEFGTRAHTIIAKKAAALAIGAAIYKKVHHPGARPHPFMRPAFDRNTSRAIDAVVAQVRRRLTKEGLNSPPTEE